MDTLVTARAVIINPQKQMLIIKRSLSDPLHGGGWDLPGGRAEVGETLEVAVKRETKEEVGISLVEPQLLFATSDVRSGRSKTWLFFVEALPSAGSPHLGNEHDEFKWIRPEDLPEYTDYDILLRFHTYITQHRLLGATDDADA